MKRRKNFWRLEKITNNDIHCKEIAELERKNEKLRLKAVATAAATAERMANMERLIQSLSVVYFDQQIHPQACV